MRAKVCYVSSLTAYKNSSRLCTITSTHITPIYRFSDLSSFLRLSCMSLSVLRGLDGLWSSRYSLIRFEKGKTAYPLCLHVSHGKLRSTSGCLDTEILSENFSHYATTHHTTFCAEHNDCVHHTYFPSIPAHYVRSTTTVWEVLLTPTVNVRFHGFIRSVKFNS